MTQRKSKSLTYLFALMPGAGQMYMGFMKLGTSIMIALFALIYLEIPLLLPVLWFYAFFDAINKVNLDAEDFYQIEDHYLFDQSASFNSFTFISPAKKQQVFGILFLIVGFRMVWGVMRGVLSEFLSPRIYQMIYYVTRTGTSLCVAAIIILIGIKLITNEKKHLIESNQNK